MADITNILNTTSTPALVISNKGTTPTITAKQSAETTSSDSLQSTAAYSLGGNLAKMNLETLQGSSEESKSSTTKNAFEALTTPAYSLAGNLAKMNLTLLEGFSSAESDDTEFYKPANNLNFLSGSAYKSLITKTIEQSKQTSTAAATTSTTSSTTSTTTDASSTSTMPSPSTTATTNSK